MMGLQVEAAQLFYEFRLDDHVPADHVLRRIDRSLDLKSVRSELKPFYSTIGRPSIAPELLMRMLIVGYCMGICSERRLCDAVAEHVVAGVPGYLRKQHLFGPSARYHFLDEVQCGHVAMHSAATRKSLGDYAVAKRVRETSSSAER